MVSEKKSCFTLFKISWVGRYKRLECVMLFAAAPQDHLHVQLPLESYQVLFVLFSAMVLRNAVKTGVLTGKQRPFKKRRWATVFTFA